ncbi:putative transferase [Blastocystis sp. subtype 1]
MRFSALRHPASADYFFLSRRAFNYISQLDDGIVIGRVRVDNYIMGVCSNEDSNCALYDSTFVTKSIHFDAHTNKNRMMNHSDENYKWNDIVISQRKLKWGSLCNGNPYMIMKRKGYMLHRRTGPCVRVPLLPMLTSRAINNTVLMMIVDYGYLDLWRNSYNAGNLSQYKNLIVLCLDEQSYKALQYQYPVYLYSMGNNVDVSFANQESSLFKKKMQSKLALIKTVLSYGFSLLYMDSDVILLKDPFPYLQSITGYDLIAQKDVTVCTGFMYIRSTNQSIALMTRAYEIVKQPDMRDQIAVITALNELSIPYYLLPARFFPNGGDFFNRYQYYWDKTGRYVLSTMIVDNDYYIFHNNYVRGRFGKELRFKEMKLYTLNVDGEYSAMRKYLTVERINTSRIRQELFSLSHIANALNRTLVLPPLPCPNKRWKYCNLCSFDEYDCFRREIDSFVNPVKESLFFTSKYVPDSIVKENLRNPIYTFDKRCENHTAYTSKFPASKDNANPLQCESCATNKTSCILQKGRKVHSYVFKLLSIDSFVCYSHSCDGMLVAVKRQLLITTAR